VVAEMAVDELDDVIALTTRINAMARRIGALAEQAAPSLLSLPGSGPLTAAKLVGETAGIHRFHSEAAFARHAGVAPIPVWSGNTAGRVRMTRAGNRQLNMALHRIAVTQIRLRSSAGRVYFEKKKIEGVRSRSPSLPQETLSSQVFGHLAADQRVPNPAGRSTDPRARPSGSGCFRPVLNSVARSRGQRLAEGQPEWLGLDVGEDDTTLGTC
jgi:transposase